MYGAKIAKYCLISKIINSKKICKMRKKEELRKVSFAELYAEHKAKPLPTTPAQAFIDEVAEVTHKASGTVRMWIMGKQTPDALAIETIANHFNVNPETLF